MTKPIIILLLITIPLQGVLYAMPVPSEGDDQKTVPVHGGGSPRLAYNSDYDTASGVALLGVMLYISYDLITDDNKYNDYLGYPLAALGIMITVYLIYATLAY